MRLSLPVQQMQLSRKGVRPAGVPFFSGLRLLLSTECTLRDGVAAIFVSCDSMSFPCTQPCCFMHALAVLLSCLRPRFAYILDHYGHARSRRRASGGCIEALFVAIDIRYIRVVGILYTEGKLGTKNRGRQKVIPGMRKSVLQVQWKQEQTTCFV